MVTNMLFICFVAFLSLQRLLEFKKSERHRAWLIKQGGREHNASHFKYMVLLHFSWLVFLIVEVVMLDPAFHPVLAAMFFIVFVIGQVLRLSAMYYLKERWTARIITLPHRPPVMKGIYRYVRHPNYLGVVIEIASAPLIFSAYYCAAIFSVLNLILLWHRIKAEENALDQDNKYFTAFALNKK